MESLNLGTLPTSALLLIDSAPIIYCLEQHPRFAQRFAPIFDAHAQGRCRLAVTTTTLAEVLTGPLRTGEESLAGRYRAVLESWHVVPLDADIAASTARLRATHSLKLADAVQVASAIAINADALVTHDRAIAKIKGLRILS
jgi:predicted nucleic acid-binding protein